MDIELGKGIVVNVDPLEQSDDWLLTAAWEIHTAAQARGLELPKTAGSAAVKATVVLEKPATASGDTIAAHDMKESLKSQLVVAGRAYLSTFDALLAGRQPRDIIRRASHEILATEFDAWLTEDKLAYVIAAQKVDPELHFTLVATPNVRPTAKEIIKAAKALDPNPSYGIDLWYELYDEYNDAQLSGIDSGNGNAVVFSLIPSKFDEKLCGTVAQQRAALVELQKANPNLKVPSVLEAIAYWNTLCAQNDGALPASDTNFDRAFIRHFNLPEKHSGEWSLVPESCLSPFGAPSLYGSNVFNSQDARVSIG